MCLISLLIEESAEVEDVPSWLLPMDSSVVLASYQLEETTLVDSRAYVVLGACQA